MVGSRVGSCHEQARVMFQPHVAQIIAAAERGEPLVPQPIRDKVIERAQSALKLIDAAEKQAQAEVVRAEQEQ